MALIKITRISRSLFGKARVYYLNNLKYSNPRVTSSILRASLRAKKNNPSYQFMKHTPAAIKPGPDRLKILLPRIYRVQHKNVCRAVNYCREENQVGV